MLGVVRRDHFLHFIAYGGLSAAHFSGRAEKLLTCGEQRHQTLMAGFLILLAHSASKEILQTFLVHRQGSLDDIVADGFGALAGALTVLYCLN